MSAVTPLLEVARIAVRYLSPAEKQVLRDELDRPLATTADSSVWNDSDVLANEPEAQTPPTIDPVELVSAMRR